jgi:uncharacterized protein (TIGR02646 family)
MIFIDKTTAHSQKSKAALETWKITFQWDGKPLKQLYEEPNQSGGQLWKFFETDAQDVKDQLREDLNQEQGEICCYCCQQLVLNKTKIEHFEVKSAPDCEGETKVKAFEARVFNYDNLLLCCDGGESSQKDYEVKVGRDGNVETKQQIADKLNISTDFLDELNPKATYKRGEKIKYTGGTHCDACRSDGTFTYFTKMKKDKPFLEMLKKRKVDILIAKNNNAIIPIINPSLEIDCWQYFEVDESGLMTVGSSITDQMIREKVENTLIVLHLNEPRLKDYRKKAWKAFEDTCLNEVMKAYNGTYPHDVEQFAAYIQDILDFQLDLDRSEGKKTKFCFVKYYVIKSLEHVFP